MIEQQQHPKHFKNQESNSICASRLLRGGKLMPKKLYQRRIYSSVVYK